MNKSFKFGFLIFFIVGFILFPEGISRAQCSFTNLNSTYCAGDAAFTLSGGTNYYGNGVVGSVFNPAIAGVGTHKIVTTSGVASTYSIITSGVYSPVTPTSSTTLLLADNDEQQVSIGFTFNFFGSDYSQLRISSNGVLGLGTGPTLTSINDNQTFQDGINPNNLIAVIWDDLIPDGSATIRYFVSGDAPFRKFIVDYINVSGKTAQAQLHETTNVIEIHTASATFPTNGSQGIEGEDLGSGITNAYVVPGRNNTSWNATNDYVAFIPACVEVKNVTVNALPSDLPVVPVSASVCIGSTIDITIQNSQIGVQYQLQNDADNSPLSGFYTGTGNDLTITSNVLNADRIIKVYARNIATLCTIDLINKASVTVDLLPTVSNAGANQNTCGSTTFLTANNPSLGVGNWTFTSGGNADGLGVIDNSSNYQSLFTGTEGQTYTLQWKITNGTCSSIDDVTVVLKEIPDAQASDQEICHNTLSSVSISNPNGVSGTSYTWIVQSSSNVSGATVGSGDLVNQVLMSTDGTSNGIVVYRITPMANGCSGAFEDVSVTVKPTPVINNNPADLSLQICSNQSLNFLPTSTLLNTSFGWTSVISGSISVSSVTANGNGVISDAPVNTGSTVANVVYTITPAVNGCNGLPVNFVVTVKPLPSATASDVIICSGESTAIPISPAPNNVSGTTFSWIVNASTNVSGAANGDGSSISQLLSSANGQSGTVTYSITPSANGCSASTITAITVTINPHAIVNAGGDYAVCEPASIPLSGILGGGASSGVWSIVSGAGSISSSTTTGTTVTATYTVAGLDIGSYVVLRLTSNDPTGPCLPQSDDVMINVNEVPEVYIFGLKSNYAKNSAAEQLVGIPLGTGGVFTGDGMTGNTFNPSEADVGSVKITYQYTHPITGCFNSKDSITIVNSVTEIDFDISAPAREESSGAWSICENSGDLLLMGNPPVNDPGSRSPTKFRSPDQILQDKIFIDGTNYKINTSGLKGGVYFLQYIYTNSFDATDTLTKQVMVYSAPQSVMDPLVSTCVENVLSFTESSTIPDNATGATLISYHWDFGDNIFSSEQEPVHSYAASSAGAEKIVRLTVTTNQGCSNTSSNTIFVGQAPKVDFRWVNICQGDSTRFEDRSDAGFSVITAYTWQFDDGENIGPGTPNTIISTGKTKGLYKSPSHFYNAFGVYNVNLTVSTDAGCSKTISKNVYILDKPQAGNYYSTDFENGPGAWVPIALENNNVSWVFGEPVDRFIASPGDNIWWTGANPDSLITNSTYFNNEKSIVLGPCVDMSSFDRPMISLNYWSDTQEGFDGAVMQYSVDGGIVWETIGNAEGEGLNWYTSRDIAGMPGDQDNFAWSEKSAVWKNARFSLDQIPRAQRDLVIFRIAFGSNNDNSSGKTLRGLAFDDIYIGNKKKTVLVEQFVNAGNVNSSFAADYLNSLYVEQFVVKNSSDFFKIQYHINTPSADELNKDNPTDPGARSFYYGISQPPITIMDGILGTYPPGGKTFNGDHALINKVELDRRALEDPLFDLTIDVLQSPENILKGTVKLTYIDSLASFGTPIIIHLALIETDLKGNKNVLRKLIWNEGKSYSRSWAFNDEQVIEFDYVIDVPIANSAKLYLAAFVQENNRNRPYVYQATIIDAPQKSGAAPVGVSEGAMVEMESIQLFPIPASTHINLSFDNAITRNYTWQLIDQHGAIILSGNVGHDWSAPQQINLSTIANGIYTMRISLSEKTVAYKKIVVLHSND
jgi:hypothetical protein